MKEHLKGRLTSQTSLFRSRDMFVGSAFQFIFLPSNITWDQAQFSFRFVNNIPLESIVREPLKLGLISG